MADPGLCIRTASESGSAMGRTLRARLSDRAICRSLAPPSCIQPKGTMAIELFGCIARSPKLASVVWVSGSAFYGKAGECDTQTFCLQRVTWNAVSSSGLAGCNTV